MKNILFIFAALITLVLISNYMTKENIIPEDAIRIRVIANSDSDEDQKVKMMVKDEVEDYMYSKLKNVDNVEDADKIINSSISNIKKIVSKYTKNYTVKYGMNFFPEKEYKSVIYDEGEYKSLVITLGSGLGKNWWCVLFPPLCLMEAEDSTDVEYRSYVIDMVNKYMK